MLRYFLLFCSLFGSSFVLAQGGPPYYTTDPGTPGNMNWEINFGYMPFLYNGQYITHTPDVDINFGVGDRIQLTYEDAWLRVRKEGHAVFGFSAALAEQPEPRGAAGDYAARCQLAHSS